MKTKRDGVWQAAARRPASPATAAIAQPAPSLQWHQRPGACRRARRAAPGLELAASVQAHDGVGDLRIEVNAGSLRDQPDHLVERLRARGRHAPTSARRGSRRRRAAGRAAECPRPQAFGIAGAVPLLVVILDARQHRRHRAGSGCSRGCARRARDACCISANSSTVSRPGLLRIESGTAILPTSCSSAESSASSCCVGAEPHLGRDAAGQRRDALGVPVRVAVLGVDGRGDRADRVEQQPFELAHQPHAVQRDAGLVADVRRAARGPPR